MVVDVPKVTVTHQQDQIDLKWSYTGPYDGFEVEIRGSDLQYWPLSCAAGLFCSVAVEDLKRAPYALIEGSLVRVKVRGVTATQKSPYGESYAVLWTDKPDQPHPEQLVHLYDTSSANSDLLTALKTKLSSFEYTS